MIPRKPSFDLTAALRRTQGNDPCWWLRFEPDSFDIIAHVNRVIARGDIRAMFAKRVARRG